MHRAASTYSPKVVASALATLFLSVVLAVVLALIDDPSQLDVLPGWARFVLVAALPTLASALAGYAKRDPLRDLGADTLEQESTTLRRLQ